MFQSVRNARHEIGLRRKGMRPRRLWTARVRNGRVACNMFGDLELWGKQAFGFAVDLLIAPENDLHCWRLMPSKGSTISYYS